MWCPSGWWPYIVYPKTPPKGSNSGGKTDIIENDFAHVIVVPAATENNSKHIDDKVSPRISSFRTSHPGSATVHSACYVHCSACYVH